MSASFDHNQDFEDSFNIAPESIIFYQLERTTLPSFDQAHIKLLQHYHDKNQYWEQQKIENKDEQNLNAMELKVKFNEESIGQVIFSCQNILKVEIKLALEDQDGEIILERLVGESQINNEQDLLDNIETTIDVRFKLEADQVEENYNKCILKFTNNNNQNKNHIPFKINHFIICRPGFEQNNSFNQNAMRDSYQDINSNKTSKKLFQTTIDQFVPSSKNLNDIVSELGFVDSQQQQIDQHPYDEREYQRQIEEAIKQSLQDNNQNCQRNGQKFKKTTGEELDSFNESSHSRNQANDYDEDIRQLLDEEEKFSRFQQMNNGNNDQYSDDRSLENNFSEKDMNEVYQENDLSGTNIPNTPAQRQNQLGFINEEEDQNNQQINGHHENEEIIYPGDQILTDQDRNRVLEIQNQSLTNNNQNSSPIQTRHRASIQTTLNFQKAQNGNDNHDYNGNNHSSHQNGNHQNGLDQQILPQKRKFVMTESMMKENEIRIEINLLTMSIEKSIRMKRGVPESKLKKLEELYKDLEAVLGEKDQRVSYLKQKQEDELQQSMQQYLIQQQEEQQDGQQMNDQPLQDNIIQQA